MKAECWKKKQSRFTIMGLGDSITEGSDDFASYLFPLWEKLMSAGYEFDFISVGALTHSVKGLDMSFKAC